MQVVVPSEVVAPGVSFTRAAAGWCSTALLTTTGELYACGGAEGHGAFVAVLGAAVRTARVVPGLEGRTIVDVALTKFGREAALVRCADGTVLGVGYDVAGRLLPEDDEGPVVPLTARNQRERGANAALRTRVSAGLAQESSPL